MSRPIAYNASGPLSGSIRGGSVNYTVDSGDRDYTTFASKKWVPSADGAAPIVFVTDTYTQGITNQATAVPLFYSCNGTGSAAIIYTANRIPGSPGNYTDANVALNDLITARGYFILESNDPFEGVDADGLVLDVDASKMSSYPQTGTNWRDLSGNTKNGTLINGTTWDSNGRFNFDGVDETISFGTGNTFFPLPSFSIELTFQSKGTVPTTGTSPGVFGFTYGIGLRAGTTGLTYYVSSGSSAGGYSLTTNDSINYRDGGRWYTVVCQTDATSSRIYVNGQFKNSRSLIWSGSTVWPTNGWNLGRDNNNINQFFTGSISNLKIYNKILSQAEINQNYYQAPIVTDGLVLAVDPSNLVSYESGSTTTYSLTGSVSGSLLNGVGYLPSYGGAWNFDGVDDRIFTNTNLSISSSFTIEYAVLIKELPTTGEYNSIFFNGAGFRNNGVYAEFGDGPFFSICTVNSSSAAGAVYLSNPQANVVYYATATYENRTLKGYINGNLVSTNSLNFDPVNGSNNTLNIGAYGPFVIPFWRFYNKPLSAAEVQQNYQAEQYRFETPAGPVTDGLVLNFDASNLDSYPGTGTTWYTLAGSDNGTLINGPLFSTEAGGCIVFDGVDDYVSFGNPLDQSQLSQVWTVQAWINITTKPAQILVSGLGSGLYIEFTQGNNSLLYLNSGVNDYYTYGGQFTAQGWVLATFRFNNANGDRQIWRNLSNISTFGPNNTSTPLAQGGTFTIGSNSSSTILGKIGNVLFYNRYLSDAEITQNYNATKAKFGL
jgi:hypothetical protein